ncbi:hypothetical protein PR048_018145 [Dryococelus australis]|uniref:DDE-1 domain-containing protein n=1 Tax=Dryococelus australis TaxID=614101 RepID=A0ABQ9HBK1_9NEOP|nr:hypothetical protein PR048_018145 [Dryococelus australis]
MQNVKVVFYPPNCTSKCQPLDMGVIKYLSRMRKVMGLLDNRSNDSTVQLKLNILPAIHYMATSWKKITPTTILNCFVKYGVHEIVSSSFVGNIDGEFKEDFIQIDGKNVGVDAYASCDEPVLTGGIQPVDALCEATQAAEDSSEDETEDTSAGQAEKIIFYEAYSPLETIKTFFYSLNTSEHHQDTLL